MKHAQNGSEKQIGVALILRNRYGEVIVLREKQTKPHLGKVAGMSSIPMETIKASEGESAQEALVRLVKEEIPCFAGHVEFEPDWKCAYRIAPKTWVLLYLGFTWLVHDPATEDPTGEVEGHAWMRPNEIQELWVRKGVREMIEDRYFSGHERRICRKCTDPPMEAPARILAES